MNMKVISIALVAVLVVSIILGVFLFSQNQGKQQTDTYTIVGTLNYAPGHAIYRGISVIDITPSVSPKPSNITFTEANEVNYTVASFVFLNFSNKFIFPQNGFGIDYPVGFAEGDVVKVSGEMSYDNVYQGYAMNVTSITRDSS